MQNLHKHRTLGRVLRKLYTLILDLKLGRSRGKAALNLKSKFERNWSINNFTFGQIKAQHSLKEKISSLDNKIQCPTANPKLPACKEAGIYYQ